jgi:hypothetical protein
MDQILVIDADPVHRRAVTESLGTLPCAILTCGDVQTAAMLLREREFIATVVATTPDSDWSRKLERIRHILLAVRQQTELICLRPVPYPGATERVYADRKGFKVVYER